MRLPVTLGTMEGIVVDGKGVGEVDGEVLRGDGDHVPTDEESSMSESEAIQ